MSSTLFAVCLSHGRITPFCRLVDNRGIQKANLTGILGLKMNDKY